MKMQQLRGLLAVPLLLLGSGAFAEVITYNLGGSGGDLGETTTFGAMTAASQVQNGEDTRSWSVGRQLYQDSDGLGVYDGGLDNKELDGRGTNEAIEFSFGSSVTLLGLGLESTTSVDLLTLDVFSEGNWERVLSEAASFAGSFQGTKFRISALHRDDSFLVNSLIVDVDSGVVASVSVSEPSTLVLLGLGILAVGASRRQR